MAYFIPKSARTVKMEIFKGFGLVECLVAATGFILAFIVMQIEALPFPVQAGIAVVACLISLFLALPSPIIPTQKSYQTLKTIYIYLSSSKNYEKKGGRK